MKVLVIHTYYQQRGGEDVVYENEVKMLRMQGDDVRTIEFDNKQLSFIKFVVSPFNPLSFLKVYREIGRSRPEVVHIHNWFFGASPSVFWAARIRKVPVIHTLHNFRILCPSAVLFYKNDLYLNSVPSIFPWEAVRLKLYRHSAISTFWQLVCTRGHHLLGTWKNINRFLCLTEHAKEIICSSYLNLSSLKVVVKPNFLYLKNASLPTSKREEHFLFVGRLTPEKGIKTLLDTFMNSAYKLSIIGDGPMRGELSEFAGKSTSISYLGYKNSEEVTEALRTCSALIVPSMCYEPFGLVIIEAYSNGTPVLVSERGAPADIVEHGVNGLHFKPGNVQDLQMKIAYWLDLPLSTKEIYYNTNISCYINKYTIYSNYKILSQIYQSVIHG